MNRFFLGILAGLILAWQFTAVAAEPFSDKDQAKFGLAQSLVNSEEYREAETILSELHRKYPENREISLNFAKCLGYGEKVEVSMALLDELEQKFPDDPEIKKTYVSILEANQKFKEAGERYAVMLLADPHNEKLLIKNAELNSWLGNYDVAKENYLLLIEKNAGNQEARLGLADVYYWSLDHESAIGIYEKMNLSPQGDPKRYQNLAKAYMLTAMPDKALVLYEKLSDLYPQDMKIRVAKISVLYDLGQNEAADKEKEALFILSGRDINIKIQIAEVLALRSRYADAIKILEEAVEIDPEHKDARLYLARIYSWDTQYGKSIALYEKLIKDFPGWVTPRREEGRVLGWSRKYKKAVQAYESIFSDIGPNEEAYLEMSAKKDFYKGFDRNAIKEYKKWLDVETDDVEALYDLGQVYSRQMQWGNARNTYTRLLRILPDHFRAKQALDKVNVYSKAVRIDGGYEFYEADSAGRDMDERYHKITSGIRYPVREDLYAGITEETYLYSSEIFHQITRQVVSVALEYYFKPIFWVKGGYSFNYFTEGVGDNHNFSGEINFKPIDMVTTTLSYDRENITDNGETIKRKLRRDNYKARVEVAPNRRIAVGGDYVFSNYTNGNDRYLYGFDVKGTLFYEPKRLQVFYRYEDYSFKSPSDFYFAPSSFHTNKVGLEWQQHLNSEELFWGINETYFTARYSINFDAHEQTGHQLFFNIHRDWSDRISTHCEWSKMIYSPKDTYSEDRVFVYLKADL